MKSFLLFTIALLITLVFSCSKVVDVELKKGMVINRSMTIKQDSFFISNEEDSTPVLTIEGNNIVVDFNGAVLIGSKNYDQPNLFKGLGISIRNGQNISIKNLTVKGYKIGMLASSIDSLKIQDADFSYNYRPKLKSTWNKIDESDSLRLQLNDNDEWLQYGMAVYLKNCNHALVQNIKITNGQNGLMLANCNNGLFTKNEISYNSGIGIGLHRSSQNTISSNYLDWTIRSFSLGNYNQEHGSASILLSKGCFENRIVHNSATHSGSGLVMWGAYSTIDSKVKKSEHTLVFNNNFSNSSTDGIEVSSCSNTLFYKNKFSECETGFSAKDISETAIIGNFFKQNERAIFIENGFHNKIRFNDFTNNDKDISLQKQGSNFYKIDYNNFREITIPFEISAADSLFITNNLFYDPKVIDPKIEKTPTFSFTNNQTITSETASNQIDENRIKQWTSTLDSLKNNYSLLVDSNLDYATPQPQNNHQGRSNIIMHEFGPYNFEYPSLWLRKIEGNEYIFAIFGSRGNWKAVGGEGFKMMSRKTGAVPATLVLEAIESSTKRTINLEYVGESFIDQFGVKHKKGEAIQLSWEN